MMRHFKVAAVGLTIAVLASGASALEATEAGSDVPVTSLGEAVIRLSDIDASMQFIPEEHRANYLYDPIRLKNHLESLLLQRAVALHAGNNELMSDFDIEELRSRETEELLAEIMLEHLIAEPTASEIEQESRAFFSANRNKFVQEERVTVSHILIKTDHRDDAAAMVLVEEVQSKLAAGTPFVELVKEYSEDSSAGANQGELTFQKGEMVPEFERAAFSMEPGELSEPVKTQFGYHLIKFTESHPGRPMTFEEMESELMVNGRKVLIDSRRRAAVDGMDDPLVELAAMAREHGFDREAIFATRLNLSMERLTHDEYRNRYLASRIPESLEPLAREYYLSRPAEFVQSEMLHLQSILIEMTDQRSREEALALAGEAEAKARNGDDFAVLARKYSDDSQGLRGRVKIYSPNQLPKALLEQVTDLETGEISKPYEYGNAVWLTKMVKHVAEKSYEYEEVRDNLIQVIRAKMDKDNWRHHLEEFKRAPFWADPELVAGLVDRYITGGNPVSESP